jgi:hypothetical protein
VFRSENPEPTFKVFIEKGAAPDQVVADFVDRAKIELQQRYEDWAEAFPELAFQDSNSLIAWLSTIYEKALSRKSS